MKLGKGETKIEMGLGDWAKVALPAFVLLKMYHDGNLGMTGMFKGQPDPEGKNKKT